VPKDFDAGRGSGGFAGAAPAVPENTTSEIEHKF
jgi:hypothetical protein